MGKNNGTGFTEALACFRLGLRELFKDKKFLLSYTATIALLAIIVAVTSTELYMDGHEIISKIYLLVFGSSVSMASEIYAIYAILGRYRKLYVNVKIISACLMWATILDVTSYCITRFISPHLYIILTAIILDPYWHVQNYPLMLYIGDVLAKLATCVLIAAIFVWVVFYPHLAMENFQQHPLKKSIQLVRKNYVPLALALTLAGYALSLIQQLFGHKMFGIILSPTVDNFRVIAYIMIFKTEFLHNILLLLPVAVFVAAFLRLTNEAHFCEKPALSKLYTRE